jgi:hypothetical protein
VLLFPQGLAGLPQTLAARWRAVAGNKDDETDGDA